MEYIIGCSIILALWSAVGALVSWVGMVAYNFLAGQFGWQTIGFWTAVAVYIVLSIIGSFFKSSK